MDEMNCVGIHCFAEAHSCKVLEKRSMEYILEHFSGVHKQVKNWMMMEPLVCAVVKKQDYRPSHVS